ncbi:MAG: hypothetical protein COB36_02820 [Alphaproteobacteria bacterium]|nr:MAG: hypothetical protein COB36_02820 [Alphaproteobacteria bacterium]
MTNIEIILLSLRYKRSKIRRVLLDIDKDGSNIAEVSTRYNIPVESIKLAIDGATLVNDLWDAGVTKFLDAQDRPILYGTVGDDVLTANSTHITLDLISNVFGISNISQYRENGIVLVGGAGDDTITGVSNTADVLLGGMGDDILMASAWFDGLKGDTYHGGSDAIADHSTDGADTADYSKISFGVTLEFGGFTGQDGIIHKSGETDAERVEDTLISIEKYRLTNNVDHVKIAAIQTFDLDGVAGVDILDFSALSGAVVVDVFHGAAHNGGAYTINFTNFGEFIGTDDVAAWFDNMQKNVINDNIMIAERIAA